MKSLGWTLIISSGLVMLMYFTVPEPKYLKVALLASFCALLTGGVLGLVQESDKRKLAARVCVVERRLKDSEFQLQRMRGATKELELRMARALREFWENEDLRSSRQAHEMRECYELLLIGFIKDYPDATIRSALILELLQASEACGHRRGQNRLKMLAGVVEDALDPRFARESIMKMMERLRERD